MLPSSSAFSHQDLSQTFHSPSQPASCQSLSASQHSQISVSVQQCQYQYHASTSPLQFSSSSSSLLYVTSSPSSSPPNSHSDSFCSSLFSNSHHSSPQLSPHSNSQSSHITSSGSLFSLSSSSHAQAIGGSHLLQSSTATTCSHVAVTKANSQSATYSVHSLSSLPEMPIPSDFSYQSFSPPLSWSPRSLSTSSQHSIPGLDSVLNPESISNSSTHNTSHPNHQEHFKPVYPGATISLVQHFVPSCNLHHLTDYLIQQ